MTRAILLIGAIAVLAGCAMERKPIPGMADTCQTTKCVCESNEARLFDKPAPVPVLWKATGEAYCPENHVLRLVEKKKKK